MKRFVILSAVLLLAASAPAQDHGSHGAHGGGHQMHEGAIEFSDGTQKYSAKVLGGRLGSDTVDGISVAVHVLQAEAPARLAPSGSGPTHLFNVTFVQDGTSELIEAAEGAVIVTDRQGETQRVPLALFESHHQSRFRLGEPGDYAIRVEFAAAGHSGTTKSIPFSYQWKAETEAAIAALEAKAADAEAGADEHEGHAGHAHH